MEARDCRDCSHYDYWHDKCRLGADVNDCDDYEINDYTNDND